MSEGFIPKGLKINFHLAKHINNQGFVSHLQSVIDDANSRLLEELYGQNRVKEEEITSRLVDLTNGAIDVIGEANSAALLNQVQAGVAPVVENHRKKLDKKLSKIRNIYTAAAAENNEFQLSRGSRKIVASGYKKKPNNGEVMGAPFPKYLREARRDRPHNRQVGNSQEYQVTPEDLEERNPINLSSQDVVFTEDVKGLLRKSPKFVPTPRGPIDEKGQYVAFLRYRETLRWKWFHCKNEDPNAIEDNYRKKPWDVPTNRAAPVATDAPELEAYLAGIERDIKDPSLRRKVKGNLNQNQINFIKEVRAEYPRKGLRIRREDKGPRYVIQDAEVEDGKILDELSNETYYTEVEEDPKEDFIDQIKFWAADAFENEEINEKQFNFVTNIDETHLAIPKPLYKTHKKD